MSRLPRGRPEPLLPEPSNKATDSLDTLTRVALNNTAAHGPTVSINAFPSLSLPQSLLSTPLHWPAFPYGSARKRTCGSEVFRCCGVLAILRRSQKWPVMPDCSKIAEHQGLSSTTQSSFQTGMHVKELPALAAAVLTGLASWNNRGGAPVQQSTVPIQQALHDLHRAVTQRKILHLLSFLILRPKATHHGVTCCVDSLRLQQGPFTLNHLSKIPE